MQQYLLELFNGLPLVGQLIVIMVGPIIIAASAFCAATPTPPPNTAWGRIYRLVELAGLLIGQAKAQGTPIPTLADFQKAIIGEVTAAAQQGRAVDLSAVLKVIDPNFVPPAPPKASAQQDDPNQSQTQAQASAQTGGGQ